MKKNLAHKDTVIEGNFQPKQAETGLGLIGSDIIWRPVDGKGRGVFTTKSIKKGQIVEVAPVVPVSKKNVPDDEAPDGYVLDWDDEVKGQEYCMALGYIMLYNHSPQPNIELESDLEAVTVTAMAIRNIAAGEELTWDYGCEIWFDTAK